MEKAYASRTIATGHGSEDAAMRDGAALAPAPGLCVTLASPAHVDDIRRTLHEALGDRVRLVVATVVADVLLALHTHAVSVVALDEVHAESFERLQSMIGRFWPHVTIMCLRASRTELIHAPRDETTMAPARLGARARSLAAVLDWIEAHYAEPLSLDGAAGRARMSRFHFSRTFKSAMGIGFREYVTTVRVQKAQQVLRERRDRVIDVAFSVGFNDVSRFYRAFRRVTGLTPRGRRRPVASTPAGRSSRNNRHIGTQ